MKTLALLLSMILVSCATTGNRQSHKPISPEQYTQMLQKGIDVNWANFPKFIKLYDKKVVQDFKDIGFSHVRIRVRCDTSEKYFSHLDTVINDCLNTGLIPIIALAATEFKKNPNEKTMQKEVDWWAKAANRYKNYSYLLSFDLMIEATDNIRHRQDMLNRYFEEATAAIRKTNPYRIVFVSSRIRSAPEYLKDIKIPSQANGYVAAEFHFYASGPSKTSGGKKWTTGTEAEKEILRKKVAIAKQWSAQTGIPLWVGAWMPGDYNKGDHYTIEEQVKFANFVVCLLEKNNIPWAVNADGQFYDMKKKQWRQDRYPVLQTLINPHCNKQ